MAIELKSITNEKYMETEIDSLVLFFDESDKESFVSEFEVPDDYMYMVMLSESEELDYPSWVEIINPSEVTETSPLPEVGPILFQGKEFSLREIIKILS